MIVKTDFIGEVEYNEEDILEFDEGLYGFPDAKKFIIIINPEEELPFDWLQSLDDETLSFIVTSPFLFVEDYDFNLPDAVVSKMDINEISDISVYTVTVIPEDVQKSTLNLKAPIIINNNTRRAKQVILNEDYPHKHKLFANEA